MSVRLVWSNANEDDGEWFYGWWLLDPDMSDDDREFFEWLWRADHEEQDPGAACGWITPRTKEKDGLLRVWFCCSGCDAIGGEAVGPVKDYKALLEAAEAMRPHRNE